MSRSSLRSRFLLTCVASALMLSTANHSRAQSTSAGTAGPINSSEQTAAVEESDDNPPPADTPDKGVQTTSPDYTTDIAPLLNKYCVGCHNDSDREGQLSLESYSAMAMGGKHGAVLVSGDAVASRLLRVLNGQAEPRMPPEGEAAPSASELQLLTQWLNAGGRGPAGIEPARQLVTPQLPRGHVAQPVTAIAYTPDGQQVAVARYAQIDLQTTDGRLISRLPDLPGKVTSITFDHTGSWLVAATGTAGLSGEAILYSVATNQEIRRFQGHRDILYAAVLSPDATLLATGSYDREIILWDTATAQPLRTLTGHNGAIFDLAFSPDGRILASASGDATIKIWRVADGERMDTLGQPLKEQYSVDISPDGQFVIAGGEDNRIRMWRLVSTDEPQINPILFARYAHEGAVHRLRFTPNGQTIVSAAADQTVKVWHAATLLPIETVEAQPDSPQALAVSPDSMTMHVGRMDGSVHAYPIPNIASVAASQRSVALLPNADAHAKPTTDPVDFSEQEPNDRADIAMAITLPAQVRGTIVHAASETSAERGTGESPGERVPDVDLYIFSAKAGETWIFETQAARDKSPLDSHIAILNDQGEPEPRVRLQAVRDSYFTFRGKDSLQTGDFRLFNWDEMKLNQLLYANGEVVKLYHYPRGPDSGFNVYPNFGNRFGYFDTTPVTHALNEPCYVVEPHDPAATLIPNGLPVFTINYENDDDSIRELGKDSRLTFHVPRDGRYMIQIKDARGFGGESFTYKLLARQPQPDFRVKLSDTSPNVPPGSGQRFNIQVERVDGFDGMVRFEVEGLPAGFTLDPIDIEPGQHRAWGLIQAEANAVAPAAEIAKQSRMWAIATIGGETIRRDVGSLGEIQLAAPPKVHVVLQPDQPPTSSLDNDHSDSSMPIWEIVPGQTSTATIRIQRHDFDERVGFGSEEGAINAPHGVYLGNIGLNGVLIVEGQTERQIFLNAEDWVQPMERVIFVEASIDGRPTSNPVRLRVLPRRSE